MQQTSVARRCAAFPIRESRPIDGRGKVTGARDAYGRISFRQQQRRARLGLHCARTPVGAEEEMHGGLQRYAGNGYL